MPSCFAKTCKNRSEQGFRMFRFPSNNQRKEIWSKLCDKEPKETSRLCEYHFDDSQFEEGRQDKWRQLKPNAVPTLIIEEHIDEIDSQLNKTDSSSKENMIGEANVQHDCQLVDKSVNRETQSKECQTDDIATFQTTYLSNDNGTIRQINEIKYLRKELANVKNKNNILISKLHKAKLLKLKAEKNMKIWKNKHTQLFKKLKEIPFLKQFALCLTGSQSRWSPECLKLATQIRYAVGWKAYLYLKKDLKLPLPSYSTLCRHISKLDFSSGLLKDVTSLLKKKKETHASSHQSDCVLLMDEMDICKTLEYDVSTVSSISNMQRNDLIVFVQSNNENFLVN